MDSTVSQLEPLQTCSMRGIWQTDLLCDGVDVSLVGGWSQSGPHDVKDGCTMGQGEADARQYTPFCLALCMLCVSVLVLCRYQCVCVAAVERCPR